MASTENGVLTDWKKLWQLVSGIHYATPNKTVDEKLMNVSKELQDGILQFKKCSSSSSDLEEFMKKKKQDKLYPFTNKLQQLLDIESEMCWELLCFYLVNEYRGSVHSLSNFISTESNMTKLLDDIWGYYSLERMIVLKIVKNLLEFHKISGHPYQEQYKSLIDKITLKKLRSSYIEQFEYLIKENPPNKLAAGEFFNYHLKLTNWAERKCRETIEILQILLLIVHFDGAETGDVKKLFECYKMHSFGREQRYLEATNDYHRELIGKITFCEVVLFLKCIDQYESPQESWIKEMSLLLDKQIIQLHHNPEHGPLLLGWMLFNFHVISQDDDDALNKYRQFGSKAVQLNVFRYLYDLLSSQLVKDESLVSRISRKTIYNLLSHLCDLFDTDGSVARHQSVNELLCELISWPSIAAEFQKTEDSGCRSLLNTAMEKFPAEFRPLANIAAALSSKRISDNKWIQEQLEALPIYTELFDSTKYSLKPSSEVEDEYILQADYCPSHRIDYCIPANTIAILTDETSGTFIHFRHPLNFFNALYNEINLLFVEALQYSEYDTNRLANVTTGIRYLSVAIEKIKSPTEITAEMVHPTERIIDLLNKLTILQNPPIELLANCLNVCAALLPLFEVEISNRVINLNILPMVSSSSLDYKKYANGICFDSSLVGSYLVNFEKSMEKYEFLLAYLNFLKTCSKLGGNNLLAVELPGLIFLLRDVFPHIHSWRFQENHVKNVLYKQILQYFFEVLQTSKEQLDQSKERRLLRDVCVYSLLNFENGIVLLKFVAIGNPYLQSVMENETNWMSSPFCPNHLVQLSMAILMQLLRLKTTIFDSETLSPLETLIYTQPKQRDTLRIIPVVTSYMSNIFNRSLPILSCRLLRRIAIEFQMSLLACLDMEPDQIRLTFLQKLPEELESDELKIAVLEFIEACIEKQPGLTEAFFKVNYDKEKSFLIKEKRTPNIGDSILTYMEEFLETISKNPKTVESPLLSRILALFHALWKNNMQTLVKDLMRKSTFWKSLCNPLLSQISGNIKAYSQLLNILGIELFCSTETNKVGIELNKVLDQFLSSDHFEACIKAFFNLPKQAVDLTVSDEIPEWLCRLQSFKDFVVILLRKKTSGIEFPLTSLKILARHCLKTLVDRAEFTDDLRPFIILSELYLVLLLHFKQKYTENARDDEEMFSNVIKLLTRISAYYEDIHSRAKESCLSIGIKIVSYQADEGTYDAANALGFLQPIVEIVSYELNNLEKKLQDNNPKADSKHDENATILSLNLLKNASVTFCSNGRSNWDMPFKAAKIFPRLLSCTGVLLQNSAKHKLSVELLDILIVFAKGNCSEEFLNCDIADYLWLKLLPPKDLFQMPYGPQPAKDTTWTSQNWWPIYSRGIELVTVLFQRHEHRFLKDVLMFVGVHEEFLMDSIFLAKQTLEPLAMVLIKNTVLLVAELVAYEREWRLEHAQSMYNMVRCIQMLMDHSISLLYRPKMLKRLTEGQHQTDVLPDTSISESSDGIVDAMNDLIEIIIISSRSLLRFSPKLLDLIAEPEFLLSRWDPLIEIQFGAPKLNAGSYPQLTFGTVLSVISLLTKALNLQNYNFHEDSLNTLPHVEKKADTRTSLTDSLKTPTTTNSPTSKHSFLKSMSVTSVTSMVSTSAANEFLSSLNGSLCIATLEYVLTFLASQTLLALRNRNLSNREKQLIRREISTELMSFHEFVRKKVLSDYRGNPWQRKKHGFVFMMDTDPYDYHPSADKPSTSGASLKSADNKRSMRVNVVRRQHLKQIHKQQTPDDSDPLSRKPSFEMSRVISPITGSSGQSKTDLNVPVESSTPSLDKNGAKRSANTHKEILKKVCTEDEEDDVFFEPEEPTYSPLSYVKLVEEDYLHFLSNFFMVICQSD